MRNAMTKNSGIDDLLQGFFGGSVTNSLPSDYFVEQDVLHINVDVAGATSDDVDITVDKYSYSLMVRVSKQYERKETKPSFYFRERVISDRSRKFDLPRSVKFDTIVASVKNGLLSISCELDPGEDCVSRYSIKVSGED